jgi:hypothetical protein
MKAYNLFHLSTPQLVPTQAGVKITGSDIATRPGSWNLHHMVVNRRLNRKTVSRLNKEIGVGCLLCEVGDAVSLGERSHDGE